jgi:uracil-DNA glycosylase
MKEGEGKGTLKSETWLNLVNELRQCRICHKESPSFVDPESFPLFMESPPQNTDIIFIFEAPNRDDTYNS